MLYHLFLWLHDTTPWLGALNVTRYITFRTAAASITAMLISLVVGPMLIRRLKSFQFGQVIRPEGPASHRPKAGTPTMGGLLILAAAIVPTLLWADLTSPYVWIAVRIDRRVRHGRLHRRLPEDLAPLASRPVAPLQDGRADRRRPRRRPDALLPVAEHGEYHTRLIVPFLKDRIPDLGWGFVPFAVLVLVSSSNTVNLTDGLDGLAISAFAVAAAAFTALAYVTGHKVFASYLLIVPFTPAAEITVFCGALVGASLGFLWFNSYPAEVFMGDVGSLALGGALGTVALLIKQELLLPIVGGLFVLEGLSVILQVASFKLTGKRIFRMAPLHHHFELVGWSEPKVYARFIIVAIVFALTSLATLKLR